jgi:hypothetical protein
MAILIKFHNVSLFPGQPFGLSELSFEIERGRRYHLKTDVEERVSTVAGLLEGRFTKESGLIERSQRLFVQSDRLLLGDKSYMQTAEEWLLLQNEFFQFGNRRRSKFGFIQTLNAKHFLDYPIYKLHDQDRIKFTLLALAFQETGISLVSKLLTMDLADYQLNFLLRIIRETQSTCCLLSGPACKFDRFESNLPDLNVLRLN